MSFGSEGLGFESSSVLLAEQLLKPLTSHIGITTPNKKAGVQWPVS